MNTQFEEIAKQEKKYHEWKRIQKQIEMFRMSVMNYTFQKDQEENEEFILQIKQIKTNLEKEFYNYKKEINCIIKECNLIMYSKKIKDIYIL